MPAPSPVLVSAALVVRNDAAGLRRALASLRGWVDEIVVVDGQSDDGSAKVARDAGATVMVRPPAQSVDADRAAAVAACTGEWILHLDSDELVPPALGRRLRSIAATPRDAADAMDAVEVHETSYFLGEPAGVWTGWKLRMARRDALDVRDKVHHAWALRPGSRSVRVGAAEGEALLHYWTDSVQQLLVRTARYTLTEAAQVGRPPATPGRMLRNALGAFRTAYFREGGRRHGWRGMYLSLHRAFYAATLDAAAAELALGGAAAIRAGYRAHADEVLRAA